MPAAPLVQGRHTWQVSATNLAGLTVLARPSTVFVDSIAPKITVGVQGTAHRLGAPVRLTLSSSDTPPLLPASAGSGVKTLTLSWGDRAGASVVSLRPSPLSQRLTHVYARTGRFRITVTAVDRAGNRSVLNRTLVVTPKPKPKPKKRRHHSSRRAAGRSR